jgi:hypothetical protein
MKHLVTDIGSGEKDSSNLLDTLTISTQGKHWALILLCNLILLLPLSLPLLPQDGFGLPTTVMLQRMPLITQK